MNNGDIAALMKGIAPVFRDYIVEAVRPVVDRMTALEKRIDALPIPRDGKDADEEAIVARVRGEVSGELKDIRAVVDAIQPAPELPDIAGMVEQAVSDAREQDIAQVQSWMDGVDEKFATLPTPRDGKDADEELIKRLVSDAVATLPPAPAGKDAAPEVVRQMVAEAVAALPVPKDGIDGRDGVAGAPGRDGNDAEPVTAEQIEAAVVAHLQANPPQAGKDADPIDLDMVRSMVAEIVEPVVAAIPQPRDGKDADPELIKRLVSDAVAALPKAKDGEPGRDGAGLAGAVIDRDGALVITLTNGEVKQLGRVVGKDGEPGKPGHDGFSLKAFEVDLMEDGRTILMKFDDGGPFSYTRELGVPAMIYRGVYREGVYQKGDTVTFGGSLWHSNKDGNTEKPDTGSGAWTLAAKRGRDGKDAA